MTAAMMPASGAPTTRHVASKPSHRQNATTVSSSM
jgi:hypothetical protein